MRCNGFDVTGAERRTLGSAETTDGSLALRWVASSRRIRAEEPRLIPAIPKTRRAGSGQPGQGTVSGAVAIGKSRAVSPQLTHRYAYNAMTRPHRGSTWICDVTPDWLGPQGKRG
ncbi:hypothetical protein EJ571_18150 [Mycobacteroides franklinii]|uniref:Uncharacterized protein n=1 Tax=Mycobacteroides franklinii TaxID=948102 RepID=A0A4R5P674_9MYCO|nr:hypothetical protein EJ571_18150 [Mycobacteroides franklinii]